MRPAPSIILNPLTSALLSAPLHQRQNDIFLSPLLCILLFLRTFVFTLDWLQIPPWYLAPYSLTYEDPTLASRPVPPRSHRTSSRQVLAFFLLLVSSQLGRLLFQYPPCSTAIVKVSPRLQTQSLRCCEFLLTARAFTPISLAFGQHFQFSLSGPRRQRTPLQATLT